MKLIALIAALIAPVMFLGERLNAEEPGLDVSSVPKNASESLNRPMNSSLNLSAIELERLEHKALEGDGASARKVAVYFQLYRFDMKEGMYWLTIGAEDGDGIAQHNLAGMLDNQPSDSHATSEEIQRNRERSCFWMRKMLENGTHLDDWDGKLPKRCERHVN